MKYYEVKMTIKPCSQDAKDLLAAQTAEAGMETFEETETGLKGYAQQQLLDEETLKTVIEQFPMEGINISYSICAAEDKDWNEQWEQEGFEPIVVDNLLTIHDGRHLPAEPSAIMIEIDAHMAFGTGTHETTRMICKTLLGMKMEGKRVLDCGCGTGILGICALKLGADRCIGYDIDEWSTDNTRHNAVINHVENRLEPLCGDATLLDTIDGHFDVVMANINRNILLQDMERFAGKMAPGATLILSGFYQADCKMLEEKAQMLGLYVSHTTNDGEWAMMEVKNEK